MSAAKTDKGTLDSQDVLLFNGTITNSPRRGMRGESERARKACEMAENDWAGRIDGVLRMEAGFEVILCRFERDVVPVGIVQVKSGDGGGRSGPEKPLEVSKQVSTEIIRGGRVKEAVDLDLDLDPIHQDGCVP